MLFALDLLSFSLQLLRGKGKYLEGVWYYMIIH